MTEFTDEYVNLLIKQYWEKSKAVAEIEGKAATFETIRDVFADFPAQFDIDATIETAELSLSGGFVLGLSDGTVLGIAGESSIGDRLDIIGKIVGLTRRSVGDLPDETYRLLLKVKIGQNNASAFLVSDDRITIQDVIELAFNGEGVVTDNQDMSLTLYIESSTIQPAFINLIVDNGLLPKPQGVRYDVVASTEGLTPFGVSELTEPDPANVLGLGELVYAPADGGAVAELY